MFTAFFPEKTFLFKSLVFTLNIMYNIFMDRSIAKPDSRNGYRTTVHGLTGQQGPGHYKTYRHEQEELIMTRQRFEGLRREMVRRFIQQTIDRHGHIQHTLDGKEIELKMGRALHMDRIDWSKTEMKSYAEAWQSMKPLRDIVGM